MKYIIALFIMCIFYTSCTNKGKNEQIKEQTEVEIVQVDFGKEYKHRKFPNTNYSMTIQKLEENEEYTIGHIDKLIVDNKRIYILDQSKAKSLFIYNRNGKLLHVINQIGTGPGEFSFPQDFDIEKKSGNIVIMDANTRKFIFYSPKGEYIKELKYDFTAVKFILDNENNIITDNGNIPSTDSSYHLKRIDSNGKILSNFFPSDPSTIGITFNPRNSLQQSNNKIFFLPTFSNCIYALDGDDPKLVYQVDFGKDWPSKEFCERVKSMHPLKIRELMFENNYVCFLNYIQTKDVLHLDFYKEKKLFLLLQ